MRRVLVICLVVVWNLPRAVLGAEFAGPLPVRNFQPIQQIFLNLPVERAQAVPVGGFTLHLESAESNEISTEQVALNAVLKFEQNRTVIGGAVGVAPGLDLGLDVPFLSRFGGFLDGFINTTEDLFGTSNPERHLYHNNTFGAFSVRRDNVVLFEGKPQYLELGDIWASAKYEGWHPFGAVVALRGAIKAPTGRAGGVFGSGKPDFGLGVAADYQAFERLMVYSNLNLVYPVGPITAAHLTLNPIVTESVAFEFYLGWRVALLLQEEVYTSPFHGTAPLLDANVVELTTGLNWSWQPFLAQVGVIDNVSGVAQAADFTLLLRLTYRS